LSFAIRCACGNPAESFGGLCDRCVALQTLGLDHNASDAQIENAHRTLVKVWHPDRFQNDPKTRQTAEEKLKEINSAHEFLASGEAARTQASARRGQPEQVTEPVVETVPVEEETEPASDLNTPEIRRILRRQRQGRIFLPKLLLPVAFSFGAIAMLGVLWGGVDAILMSNPRTAVAWEQSKAEVIRDLQVSGLKLWGSAMASAHGQRDEKDAAGTPSQSPSPVVQETPAGNPASVGESSVPASKSARLAGLPHIQVGDATQSVQPYVTSGLTPMEVLSILGKPTSSTGEKMVYNDSEVDFRNGRVVGWAINAKMSPIRVKLWPERALVPGVTQFALGSSKNDVIALQGTPTLFSDNKFGYGDSMVFFQNNRVIGWKEDPNSVQLRVAH